MFLNSNDCHPSCGICPKCFTVAGLFGGLSQHLQLLQMMHIASCYSTNQLYYPLPAIKPYLSWVTDKPLHAIIESESCCDLKSLIEGINALGKERVILGFANAG